MKVIYLVRGCSGSGKTTKANQMAEQLQRAARRLSDFYVPVVCAADDYFEDEAGKYVFDPRYLAQAHKECQRVATGAMQRGVPVIVHNTFTQRWEMHKYYELAVEYGYTVKEIVCKGKFKNLHGVPDEVIERQRARWEN